MSSALRAQFMMVSRIFRTFVLVTSNPVFPFPKLLPVPWLAPRFCPSLDIALDPI
jgi:hypothetical protein